MEENISERSGFVRLALGTGLTALGVSHLAKDNGNRGIGALLVAAGAMKVAEGAFLYCPTKALISSNMKDAVASSFSQYLDPASINGDSIIQAYNESYSNRWGTNNASSGTNTKSKNGGKNAQSQSNSGSSKSSGSKANDMASAASDIANIVKDATSDSSMATLATQATKAASAVLDDQKQQKQNNSSYSN